MIRPDFKKDKFISRTEIGILIDGMPSMNFKEGKVYNHTLFHYNADLYQNNKGEKYYLFRSFDDCTLYIMNCNKEIYEELYKQIELDDSIPIFGVETKGEKEEDYYSIPIEYRKEDGFGGNATIIFK